MEANDPELGADHVENPIDTLKSIGLRRLMNEIDSVGVVAQELIQMGLFTLDELSEIVTRLMDMGVEAGKIGVLHGASYTLDDLMEHKHQVYYRFKDHDEKATPISEEKASETVTHMMQMQDQANQMVEKALGIAKNLITPTQVWPKEDDEHDG